MGMLLLKSATLNFAFLNVLNSLSNRYDNLALVMLLFLAVLNVSKYLKGIKGNNYRRNPTVNVACYLPFGTTFQTKI